MHSSGAAVTVFMLAGALPASIGGVGWGMCCASPEDTARTLLLTQAHQAHCTCMLHAVLEPHARSLQPAS